MQHFREGLEGGSEVKAFARSVVVGSDHLVETLGREIIQVGLARDEATHPADGVFDASLLPGRVGIAEEGLDRKTVQRQMTGELGAIVEGHGLSQALGQGGEQAHEMAGDPNSDLAGDADAKQQARGSLVNGQDRLAVFGEHHQVGFPMSRDMAAGGLEWPFCQRNTAFDETCGAAASFASDPALTFAAWQVTPPAAVPGAPDLGVDEAVNGLVRDHLVTALEGEPTCDLLWRPTPPEALQHRAAQVGLPCEAYARPAPRSHLLLGIAWPVTDRRASIALQLPRDR